MKMDLRLDRNPFKAALVDALHSVMCGASTAVHAAGGAAAFLRPILG